MRNIANSKLAFLAIVAIAAVAMLTVYMKGHFDGSVGKGLQLTTEVQAAKTKPSPVKALTDHDAYKENIYPVGKLKPTDSVLKVKVGERAPDFTLPAVQGDKVTLSQYRGKKNVVISFVPAAWTPVCSDQWPGYNIAQDFFDQNDAILLGITVDNIPTLFAWTNQMCSGDETLWFPVLSDFYPHGAVAKKFGVLRSEGVTERALFVIDKKGIIRYIDVHDINKRPRLEDLVRELEKLTK